MGQKAIVYLCRYKKIDLLIANKEAEKKMWLEMAEGVSSPVGGERVQSSKEYHPMENKVVEAAMIDAEIAMLKEEKKAIVRTIEQLPPDEYDLLHKVYVQGKSLKEVQADHGMSYSWATTMHRKAKRDLEKLIN
jgi:DNA-directed RNA polymerase specialized sigma24 family protein